ncbi:MAG: glycoside hydrolase family 127 protein, partial [Planctomycetota bacterium]
MRKLPSPIAPAVLGVAVLMQGVLPARAEDEDRTLTPVAVRAVRIADEFWAPKLRVYGDQTIAHSWQHVDSSIRELINAAKPEKKPARNGKWMEANLHKVLETAAYALALGPKPELERKVDEVVAVIAAGQRSDGFAHAWVITRNRQAWGNLYHQHDGYVSGHLYEAAAAHFRVTGKRNLLDVACKSADQAWRHFIEKKNPGFPGHAEMELALVELYRVTGNRRYLDLARAFIQRRGAHPEQASRFPPDYFQDHLPVRRQQEIKGHAVRAVFFATGVADLALEGDEKEMREAAGRLWRSAAKRKMYITGSAGASARHEAFGPDYELPNAGYCESCAACGMANLAHRMLRLEAHADAADELERILYNAVLHGIGLDGKTFYYRNPLSDRNHPRGNNWCCCPPTLSRTLLQVGRYAYAHTDEDIYVNLYVRGTCAVPLSRTPVTLRVETEYPWDGAVRIAVQPRKAAEFSVRLRVPGWCRGAKLKLNGKAVGEVRTRKGYTVLRRRWRRGDTIELEMPMPVMRMEA